MLKIGQKISQTYRTPEKSGRKIDYLLEIKRRAEGCSYLTEKDIQEICEDCDRKISNLESSLEEV